MSEVVSLIFLMKEDCERIYSGCDLGDSVKVSAYQYPHVLQLPHMTQFIVRPDYDKLQAKLEIAREALKEIAQHTEYFGSEKHMSSAAGEAREALEKIGGGE